MRGKSVKEFEKKASYENARMSDSAKGDSEREIRRALKRVKKKLAKSKALSY